MERGRVYVVVTEEPDLVQTMKIDEQTAIDYALSGIVSEFPRTEVGWQAGRQVVQGQPADHRETDGSPTYLPSAFMPYDEDDPDELEPDALEHDDLVTLSEAAERLALSLKTLRNARETSSKFPEPVSTGPRKASLYHFSEIEKWAIDRASGAGGDAA
jgi:predicted DNA-binding transcriptional regulator AlpA